MFQIGGMASGLDTTTIIEQLMLLERKPIVSLQNRKAQISKADSAFQAINTRLSALTSKLTDLKLAKNLAAKKTLSSAESVLTGTATPEAAEGAYRVKVNQLATATKVNSSGSLALPAGGSLKLSELKPVNAAPITTGTFTVGGATLTINNTNATLNEIVAALNGAGSANVSVAGSTGLGATAASLTPEGQIQLNVAANSSVAIGSGSDSSNFLAIAGLTSPTVSTTFRIGARMNVGQAGEPLSSANFGTAATGSGSFKINGVEISYSAGTDTLNDVLSRINSSTAGVLASYNSIEDRIVLTNKASGNSAIGLMDVTGNFLAATKLLGATQSTGQNARITVEGVNGDAPIESSTNEFTSVIPGLTLTAKEVNASWTTLTVSPDTQTTLDSVKAFVNEFNTTVDAITAARGKGQPLQGDSALGGVLNTLYRLVYEPVSGLTGEMRTLSSIGIGTTSTDRKHITLDEAKFKEALAVNPERVTELFNKDATTEDPTGVAGRISKYLGELGGSEGIFTARKDSVSRRTKDIDDQIARYEERLEQRRKILVNQFTAMEKAVGLMKSQQSAMLAQLGSLQSQ